MSEIVFILGAGASRHAGAPLMADFLDKADELRKEGKAGNFKEDFDRVFHAISALQIVHSKSELDLDNIESVFAAFEMARLVGRLPGISSKKIRPLLASIRRVILGTLEKTITYPVAGRDVYPNPSYDSLAKLINELNDEGRHKRCSIITFNYDLALDYALYFNGHPADYCLPESVKRGRIPLMKLHGSLNWAICSKCRRIIPWDLGAFFQTHSWQVFGETKSAYLNLGSELPAGLDHCGKYVKPEPVIVPPTWNKTEYHKGLSAVWTRAASELSDAENIFVSGYSLTETDSFFRYLFALGSVGEARIKRFWVFNPDKENKVLPRFQKLIGPGARGRFRFEKQTFGALVDLVGAEFRKTG